MKRIILAGLVVLALVGVAVAYAFLKPTTTASGPIEAIPVALATQPPASAAPAAAQPTQQPAAAPTEEPTADVGYGAATAAVEGPTAPAEPPEATTAAPAPAAAPIIFEIRPEESQASFTLDEMLRGAPKTVIGATNQVAGQIAINPADPGASQVGTILINARTLATDDSRRDRAVQNRVLLTDQFEFISFTPTALAGLPEAVTVGQLFTFQITGDLTIRDVTREVTWEATVTPVSVERLEGSATATIPYAEWGLAVPQLPFVANVSEEAQLKLDFVATS